MFQKIARAGMVKIFLHPSSKLAITVDVEDWYHIPSVTGSPFSIYRDVEEFFATWKERYDYLSGPTARVLDLLDEYDVTATFFVVADVLDHYPGLVESIVERGHEIGCHGLHHACVIDPESKKPMFPLKVFEYRVMEAKRRLEAVYKGEVVGYRAPNALMGDWMFESLIRMNFKYDSSLSLNSLYKKSDLSTSYSSDPFVVKKPEGEIIEFPMAFLNLSGFKIPTSGGPMLRFLGAHVISWGLQQSLRRGHSVFYFHPIDISTEVFPRVGRGRPFYWFVKGERVERRVRGILEHFKEKGVDLVPLRTLVTKIGDKSLT